MNIIESTNIDLIEPFPVSEAKRVFGWMHAYKNIVESDGAPKTPETFEEFFKQFIPKVRSFGVIDKFNRLGINHEAPLVGMIVFEPVTQWNYYGHLASTRRAWGSGMIDEGLTTLFEYLFHTQPELLRISAMVLPNNGPVKGLMRRLNFKYEAKLEDMLYKNGEPTSLLHFCLTRRAWDEAHQQPPPAENLELNFTQPTEPTE